MLHPRLLRGPVQFEGLFGVHGARLFAVDVLARRNGFHNAFVPQLCGLRIEIDGERRVLQELVEIRREWNSPVCFRERLEFGLVPAHEHRLRQDGFARPQLHAALLPDGENGADEVLVRAHASRDAVHDNADTVGLHAVFLPGSRPRFAATS